MIDEMRVMRPPARSADCKKVRLFLLISHFACAMPSELISPESFAAQACSGLTPEMVALKRAAWIRFCQLPLPKRTDEAWRFANTSVIRLNDFVCAPSAKQAKCAAAVTGADWRFGLENLKTDGTAAAATFVFANGRLVHSTLPSSDTCTSGFFCGTIAAAIKAKPDLLNRFLFATAATPLGGDKFLTLHQAYLSPGGGVALIVPDDCKMEGTVAIVHYLSGRYAAIFPHTLVLAGKNSSITFAEFFYSGNDSANTPNLAVPVCDIHADTGAKVMRVAAQDWSRNVHAHHLDAVHAARGCR